MVCTEHDAIVPIHSRSQQFSLSVGAGFQIVWPHRPFHLISPPTSLRSGGGGGAGVGAGVNGGGGKASLPTATLDVEVLEEYLLSVGRIFHRVSLHGSGSIKVAIFRPRTPYSCCTTGYRWVGGGMQQLTRMFTFSSSHGKFVHREHSCQ